MLKEATRQAISTEILISLKSDKAVETVKAARDIFHAEWNDNDIQLLCEHVKEHGANDWASEIWENDVDQIFKQIHLFTLKATDFQLVLWLKKIWKNDEKTLKFLCSCEQELN